MTHCWNFFETSHGKGENDTVGACVRRELRRYQMNPHVNQFESADQVVGWCKLVLRHENNLSRDLRKYVYIHVTNVHKIFLFTYSNLYDIQ